MKNLWLHNTEKTTIVLHINFTCPYLFLYYIIFYFFYHINICVLIQSQTKFILGTYSIFCGDFKSLQKLTLEVMNKKEIWIRIDLFCSKCILLIYPVLNSSILVRKYTNLITKSRRDKPLEKKYNKPAQMQK